MRLLACRPPCVVLAYLIQQYPHVSSKAGELNLCEYLLEGESVVLLSGVSLSQHVHHCLEHTVLVISSESILGGLLDLLSTVVWRGEGVSVRWCIATRVCVCVCVGGGVQVCVCACVCLCV